MNDLEVTAIQRAMSTGNPQILYQLGDLTRTQGALDDARATARPPGRDPLLAGPLRLP
ncbi:MAG: hypothetical protein H6981_06570 [Gammaproteobacteria bacterium]|nr:hypothetical protein [Gammaproteobacteria bacterium]MCP5136447.1 hypothetical protein [Gammaproteobacteria bacterium]